MRNLKDWVPGLFAVARILSPIIMMLRQSTRWRVVERAALSSGSQQNYSSIGPIVINIDMVIKQSPMATRIAHSVHNVSPIGAVEGMAN